MSKAIMIGGTGGDGTQFAVEVLAYALDAAGYDVLSSSVYGPEKRGGVVWTSLTTAAAGKPIPLFPEHLDILLAMDDFSLLAFEGRVAPGGLIVLNRTRVNAKTARTDVSALEVDAGNIAMNELNNSKASNMVMLGACIARSGMITIDQLLKGLALFLGAHKKPALFEANRTAILRGAAEARAYEP